MQPPSGGLRDLVPALAAPANASKASPRLRLTALMTASVLLGTLWTVWGYQTAVGNHHSIQMLPQPHLGLSWRPLDGVSLETQPYIGRCSSGASNMGDRSTLLTYSETLSGIRPCCVSVRQSGALWETIRACRRNFVRLKAVLHCSFTSVIE